VKEGKEDSGRGGLCLSGRAGPISNCDKKKRQGKAGARSEMALKTIYGKAGACMDFTLGVSKAGFQTTPVGEGGARSLGEKKVIEEQGLTKDETLHTEGLTHW